MKKNKISSQYLYNYVCYAKKNIWTWGLINTQEDTIQQYNNNTLNFIYSRFYNKNISQKLAVIRLVTHNVKQVLKYIKTSIEIKIINHSHDIKHKT